MGLRQLLARAQHYQRSTRSARRQIARWQAQRRTYCRSFGAATRGRPKAPGKRPSPPKRDIGLETLAGVIEGRVKVHCHCYRADDMANVMRVAREFGFKVQAFHHAVEAYKIRDKLARAGTATVTWVNWWGFKIEAYDAIPENAALVRSAGALVSLHSDSSAVS